MILQMVATERAQAERLDEALESRPGLPVMVPPALRELAALADEVAAMLAEPVLGAAQRRRLFEEAVGRAARRRRPAARLAILSRDALDSGLRRRGAAAVTVGGAAVVALAVAGIAALRGRQHTVARAA